MRNVQNFLSSLLIFFSLGKGEKRRRIYLTTEKIKNSVTSVLSVVKKRIQITPVASPLASGGTRGKGRRIYKEGRIRKKCRY
jgi:hypothetical protein